MRPLLALDVAAGPAAVCLILEDGSVFSALGDAGKQHSQTVLPLIQGVLAEAHIDWKDLKTLVFGQGPGSFTGLRIGAAILSGINASLQLPVWGISSLAITSLQIDTEGRDTEGGDVEANVDDAVWVLEDARAGEVFAACYRQGVAVVQDDCRAWAEMGDVPAGQYVAHADVPIALDGWQRLPLLRTRMDAMEAYIKQYEDGLVISSLGHWAEPVYLQLSQAEKNLKHG